MCGCLAIFFIFAYGLLQIYAGFLGIEYHLGVGWAITAIVATFIFRFTLPITIGSFFGAMNIWGWHWFWALLFAAPGLAFVALMIPGFFASFIEGYGRKR